MHQSSRLTKDNNVSDALAGSRRVGQHQLVLPTVGPGGLPHIEDRVLLVLVDGDAVAIVLDLLEFYGNVSCGFVEGQRLIFAGDYDVDEDEIQKVSRKMKFDVSN